MRNTHALTKYLTRKDRELELVKVFKFSDKIPGFSKIIELCLNFSMGFCIT